MRPSHARHQLWLLGLLTLAGCPDFNPSHYSFPCEGADCPCSLAQCETPAQACLDEQTLVTYQPLSCSPQCTFRRLETACGKGCRDGGCADEPCAGATCESPPGNACLDSATLRAWVHPGTCENGVCHYGLVDLACAGGCAGGRCKDDLCAGVMCTVAPPPECNGDIARTFSTPGVCSSTNGQCQYSSVETTCAMGCAEGACLTGVELETIYANKKKPNLWLLVDRSGSMMLADVCAHDGGTCQNRLGALQEAMNDFLTQSGDVARMALSFFPESSTCAPSNAVAVGLPAPAAQDEGTSETLKAHSAEINASIAAIKATGGTPTGASVAFVGSQGGLLDPTDGRDDFILLLTDGLPNCNDANPHTLCDCNAASVCTPAQVSGCACTSTDKCQSFSNCAIGCLDQDGTASQLAAQKAKGIRTIVVAFGPDATGTDAAATLGAMAAAGGSTLRQCPNGTDAECGSEDSCVVATHLCSRQYFKANNTAEMGESLKRISTSITQRPAPCAFKPSRLLDAQHLVGVLVDGVNVPAGSTSWELVNGTIVFAEASSTCLALKAGQDLVLTIRYKNP